MEVRAWRKHIIYICTMVSNCGSCLWTKVGAGTWGRDTRDDRCVVQQCPVASTGYRSVNIKIRVNNRTRIVCVRRPCGGDSNTHTHSRPPRSSRLMRRFFQAECFWSAPHALRTFKDAARQRRGHRSDSHCYADGMLVWWHSRVCVRSLLHIMCTLRRQATADCDYKFRDICIFGATLPRKFVFGQTRKGLCICLCFCVCVCVCWVCNGYMGSGVLAIVLHKLNENVLEPVHTV